MPEPQRLPYVSFVTWGRNDGYTDSYTERMTQALVCLVRQLEAAALDAEIVISEWNPAPGRPLLVDVLELPANSPHVAIRGVVSDPRYHAVFKGADKHGMHNGEAINVGLRRARGTYVTPKASDTYLSQETINRMARRDLDSDTLYRVDRYDVVVPAELWDVDGSAFLAALETLPAERLDFLQQEAHWRVRDLHTNASGDFLLLSSRWWHQLHGHPADDLVFSLDGDSLIMHAAAALGVRECRWLGGAKVFKPRHGHLNNARTSVVWRPWQRKLEEILIRFGGAELAHQGRMTLDYPKRQIKSVLAPSVERHFVRPASRWAAGAVPVPTQPANWGLADRELATREICRAAWES